MVERTYQISLSGQKSKGLVTVLILLVLPFFLAKCHRSSQQVLMVATAASAQYAMEEIVDMFTSKTGQPCEVILGSSGKLTAQIREGAPYDLFVSANMKYPEELFRSGFTTEAPEVYAFGNLVLWTMKKDLYPGIKSLTDPGIMHIALANPKMAPYGLAAEQVLNHFGVLEEVSDKLVFGESISQTNQFVISEAADLGFTAKSVVLSPQMKNEGKWIEVQNNTHQPLPQGVVILKHDLSKQDLSRDFYRFLFSKEVQAILVNHGYSIK